MSDTFKGDHAENSPPWLLQPYGKRWVEGFGQVKDNLADRAKQAAKADLPLICPVDSLPVIGEEVGLPRGYTEPEANYRARLVGAWDAWQWAGTPYGLLRAFQLAGYPNVLLQCQSGRQYQLGTGGTLPDLTSSAMASPVHLGGSPSELWSDIAVLILKPWPTWWGGTAPADGSQDQKSAAAMILKWKNGHNRCVKLTVVAGPTWGLMTWGSFTWGGGTNTVWTPPAG